MNQQLAIDAFAALAQESRMMIFRLLVRSEPRALPVGEISNQLNILPSTLSGHLSILRRAGLLKSARHQREIHYSANLAAINGLIEFLLEDCCSGRVDHCSEILSLLANGEAAT